MGTANYSTNLGLPTAPITQEPELFQELLGIYRAIGTLQVALDQYTGVIPQPQDIWSQIPPQATLIGGNLFRMYRQFGVAISAGQMVSVGGTGLIQLADALTPNKCRGWSTGTVVAGDFGEVITFGGTVTYPAASLNPGATYWLSDTPGFISTVPGTTPQVLGFALTDTIFVFQPQTV